MTREQLEDCLYDLWERIRAASEPLRINANELNNPELKKAYQESIYATCTSLELLAGKEAFERGKLRQEQRAQELKEFLADKKTN